MHVHAQSFFSAPAFSFASSRSSGAFRRRPAGSFQDLLFQLIGRSSHGAVLFLRSESFSLNSFTRWKRSYTSRRPRQVLPDRLGVCPRQVGRHGLDPCPRRLEPFPEGFQGIGLSLPDKHDRRRVESSTSVRSCRPRPMQISSTARCFRRRSFLLLILSRQVALLLQLLDQIPSHAQVVGHVLDRRHPRQLRQRVLQRLRVWRRYSSAKPDLQTRRVASPTSGNKPEPRPDDRHRFEPYGNAAKTR